jgi:hypothetical protein
MRYKISSGKYIPDKEKFLFVPRYCGGCLTCFWLEKATFYWSGSWWSAKPCPLCGGFLWLSKKSAQGNDAERCRQEKEIQRSKITQ